MRKKRNKEEPMLHRGVSGSWRVRFFDQKTGKLREKSCKTKSDAMLLKRVLMQGGDFSPWFGEESTLRKAKTFEDLAKLWLEHGKYVRNLSSACMKNYECHLNNHILPAIGSILLSQLSIDHIEELSKYLKYKKAKSSSYVAVRKNRWDDSNNQLSLNYQKEILTVACMITTWASSRKPCFLRENPFEGFKLPKCPEHAYDYWSLDDEDKFFEWLEKGAFYQKNTTRYHQHGKNSYVMKLQLRNHEKFREIILVALRTGMRLGEIGALRNADVDLNGGFVIVRGTYCSTDRVRKNTTKGKKPRMIEINKDVSEIHEKYKDKPQLEPIFNIHMNSIKFFSRTCRWAGVKEIHFHSLRHTCLTNLANGYGMDKALPIPKVQQIAGHSDIKTTMRYVHNDIIQDTASLQWSREERMKARHSDRREESPCSYTDVRGRPFAEAQGDVPTTTDADSAKEIPGRGFAAGDDSSTAKVVTIRRRLRLVSNEA